MNKIGIAALAAVAALVLGFGARVTANTAHADTTGIAVVPCELLASPGVTAGNAVSLATACAGGQLTDATVTAIANNLHGDTNDDPLVLADLTALETLGGKQISSGTGVLVVFAFVNDQATVTFDAPTGLAFEPATAPSLNDFTCDATVLDPDCDAAKAASGADGVVNASLDLDTATAGSTLTITVTQDTIAVQSDINVVGPAHTVTLALFPKSTIQKAASTGDVSDCATGTDVTDSSATSSPASTLAIATVTDLNGTTLTRAVVAITSGTTSVAKVATGGSAYGDPTGNTGETVDAGTAGIAQFAIICGNTTAGTSTITADINKGETNEDKDSQDVTVVGPPATVALTADPAAIACDGTATATVTAKITDSAGNNVADGTAVTFSVVALGTANPISTTTKDGTATSTITPLSGSVAGTTVVVTAGDNAAQASIRVDCLQPTPTVPAATPTKTGGGGGTIVGPNTGTGGYLGQDGTGSFPMWTLIALALGSVALVAGGMVTRRAGK